MSDTFNLSATLSAAIAADPICLFLQRGGSWFEADQMFYRRRLANVRAQIASTDPTDTDRRTELLRSEADALVNLGQMTREEFNSLFPSVSSAAPVAAHTEDDSASTVSVVSVPSICSTRTSKSSRPPQHRSSYHRPAHRSSGSHHKSTPARPTRPVAPEAPKKVTFGTQSRFAALLSSDSE